MNPGPGRSTDVPRSVRASVVVLAVLAVVVVVVWKLGHVLLVGFAAILLAVFLQGLASVVHRRAHLPHWVALVAVIVTGLGLVTGFGWLVGPSLAEQLGELRGRLPESLAQIESGIGDQPWAQSLLGTTPDLQSLLPSGETMVSQLSRVFATMAGALGSLAFLIIIGVFLAVDPELYQRGVLWLLPPRRRERVAHVLATLGHSLRWWLVGRFASMTAVGVLTFVALWLVGVPLALALGVIAGLLSFIPFVGPVVSAVPALLVALAQGPVLMLWVLLVYIGVQILEGNFITPIIQQRVVSMPPVMLLASQVLMGVLFGFFGLLLATPLAVVGIVLVQMFYLQDVLGEKIEVLGEGVGRETTGGQRLCQQIAERRAQQQNA